MSSQYWGCARHSPVGVRACPEAGILLFVLPPRSPKLNGHVERAQGTHTQEFWEYYEGELKLPSLRPALRNWERIYNTVRPHHSLGYRTPEEFYQQWLATQHHRKEVALSDMS